MRETAQPDSPHMFRSAHLDVLDDILGLADPLVRLRIVPTAELESLLNTFMLR